MKAVPCLLAALLATAASAAIGAERGETITRTFPASPGMAILIDAGPLDLFVRSAEIGEVRLKIELSAGALKESQANAWLEAHRPTIEDSEGRVRVVAPDPGGVNLFKGVVISRARMELVLPPGVVPDLSTSSGRIEVEGEFNRAQPLRLRSAGGDIILAGWAPQLELRSTSGPITVRASRAIPEMLARSASGDITLSGGARRIRCDSSSGDVRLEGLLGATSVATTSGAVSLRFDLLGNADEVQVTSGSGKVRLTLPPGSTPRGDVTSARGEIRSIYPGEADPKGGRLTLAGTGPRVVVGTTSGSIELL